MFYRKVISFTAVVLMVYFSLGMAQAPQQNATAQEEITKTSVEETIANTEAAYVSRSVTEMMELLDKNYEGWLNFKSNLQDYFFSVKYLQVYFVIDSFLTEADKVSVRLHWFKKAIDNAGAFSKTQGSSQFVFTKYALGLKLFYIRGENPFY